MAALQYGWSQGERMEQLTETAGTDPSTAANTAAIAMATTTVAANIATLVADGASPTQGHVNTLNTNWGTLLTLIDAAKVAAAAAIPVDTVEVRVLTGQRALTIIQGLDNIKARIATSKVLAP